jgi:hypothetical protein
MLNYRFKGIKDNSYSFKNLQKKTSKILQFQMFQPNPIKNQINILVYSF